MKRKSTRFISLLTAGFLLTGVFTGCGSKSDDKKAASTAAPTAQASTSQGAVYPIKTGETLSIWTTAVLQKDYQSPETMPFYQDLEKKTGVKVKWSFGGTTGDQQKQNFSLMLASGDLPDIIEYDWGNPSRAPGGPDSYIKNNQIIKLNDIIKKFAPNSTKYYADHPEIDKAVKTDEGNYFCFPFIRGEKYLSVYQGPTLRKDWLDEVGLGVPETMDEWHTMLVAFKEKKGATAPLTFQDGLMVVAPAFLGAYSAIRDYYVQDGQVKFGAIEPGYKEAMKTLSAWYKEGLIDKDIATVDGKIQQARVIGGQSGAFIGSAGTIGIYMPLFDKTKDPKANLVGAKYPVLKKGDIAKFGQYDNLYSGGYSAAITTRCKNVELAARYLDYGYSEEGKLLWNYGREGESYTMVNGKPTFTKAMYDYGDFTSSISRYSQMVGQGISIQDRGMYEQKFVYPSQKEAIELYTQTDIVKYKMPPITQTSEESEKIAQASTNIDTYVKEMYFKFLLGAESLDKFDDYVANVKKLGLEQVLAAKNAALKRYIAR